MIRLAIIAVATVLATAGPAAADVREYSLLTNGHYRLATFLHDVPSAGHTGTLFDHLVQPTLLQIEDAGGFSTPDDEKVSIYGDSWTVTQWYVDGYNLTDPLSPGAAGIRIPFRMLRSLNLVYEENPRSVRRAGVSLRTVQVDDAHTIAGVRGNVGDVGGIWPPAKPIMDGISGRHPRDREVPPSPYRRHQAFQTDGWAVLPVATPRVAGVWSVELRSGVRTYNDFGPVRDPASEFGHLNGTYDEPWAILSVASSLRPERIDVRLLSAAEYRQRGYAGNELELAVPETARQRSIAVFQGVESEFVRASVMVKQRTDDARDHDFDFDLRDPDGQGLAPWQPAGDWWAVDSTAEFRSGPFFLMAGNRALVFRSDRQTWSHDLFFEGAPYGRVDLTGTDTVHFIGDNRAGFQDGYHRGKHQLDFDIHLSEIHGLVAGDANRMMFANVGLQLDWNWFIAPTFTPFIGLAKTPQAVNNLQLQAIDGNYLSGRQVLFNGAQEQLLDTFGGQHLTVDPELKPADVYSVSVGFSAPWNDTWSVEALGLLKLYHNHWAIRFDGAPEQFGYFADDVFYYGYGPKAYTLTNRSGDLPRYQGVHLQLVGQKPRRFVYTFSFTAYNVFGDSAFGNGPMANDLGVVNYLDASPNARFRGRANLDSDRAFLVRTLAGVRVVDEFWTFLTVAQRDGTPFAFYDIHQDNGQVARIYREHRGSPGTGLGPRIGSREDFQLNVDLKGQYTARVGQVQLKTWLLVSNLLDFGNTINEAYNNHGPDYRTALETEIPRVFSVGIEVSDF